MGENTSYFENVENCRAEKKVISKLLVDNSYIYRSENVLTEQIMYYKQTVYKNTRQR